jgi:gluconolactonase
MENWREAMAWLWKGWPERVKAGPSAPRAQDVLLPDEAWRLLAEGFKSTRGPVCNARGEVFFADTTNNKIHRIGLDGNVSVFASNTDQASSLTVGADGALFSVSPYTTKIMRYDASGKSSNVAKEVYGNYILAHPNGGFYVTENGPVEWGRRHSSGDSVSFIKDGKKTELFTGLKHATGLAYRPDQWLLSVADGESKWVYSYQIKEDGTLTNGERFFHLYVADWDDDAGAESVCYALEGQMFVATRTGIQVCADDGPTQVILPVPDRRRVIGVCLGGRDMDTLFAFCGDKIWKRKVKTHAMGAFTPWTKVSGTKL